ncbi:MAG TPA: MoxR family ATPase, partial [Bacteroidetes bacterium]|nr:MoxR family ATPase [Bacteroidota bacterium]
MTKTTIKKLEQLKKELKKVVKGRDKLIDALVLGIASNQHVLLIGKHGEAKSYLVENLAKATGLNYFASQIHQETIVKDIVGLLNPVKYREGEIDILKTKFWNSEILFFDEFLRGRSEFLDFLLEVMVERKTSKTLLGETKLPVISVIATSNPLTEEYNTERMDLALKDRFFAIISIDHLIADEANANTIHDILLNNATEVENVGLTRDELISFSEEAKKVDIDIDAVIEIFVNAY